MSASRIASGTDAIGMSLDLIRSGRTQVMIAGGTEADLIPVGIAGYQQLRALSTIDYPERASRPFDARRDGFVPSEGAAVLIMESEEFALQRGAIPFAEIAGYGASSDAFHLTAPHPEGQGAVEAVQEAMRDADIKTSDIVYINAHGTSTTLNDRIETLAALESEEFALQRGAVPLAEIAGYGASSDAFHLTAPHPEGQGAVEAVQEALRDADVKTSDIVYINAPGTSTTLNDRIEILALKRALGEGISNILVGSTKSMLGHAQGATGAIEAVAPWACPLILSVAAEPRS